MVKVKELKGTDVSLTDPCKKQACAIQDCLQKNGYQEWKCQHVIDALYKCCEKYQSGESTVCDGIHSKDKKQKI